MGVSLISALLAGILFGFGLCLSRMVDPSVVVGFLDVTGAWDARLFFVMAGALLVTMVTFPFITRKCAHPVCDTKFYLPSQNKLDSALIIGSALFGIGWGLGGVCPGPAVTALSFWRTEAYVFFAAMAAGMIVHRWVVREK